MKNDDSPEMKEKYKERLRDIITKKMKTVMIYPLSQVEETFGILFGLGKEDNDLTHEEFEWREKYYKMREKILNLGNKNIRNMQEELSLYSVIFERYKTVFLPPQQYQELTSEQKELRHFKGKRN